MSTSTLIPATEQLLSDSKTALEQGFNIALAAQTGYEVVITTGSTKAGMLAFLFELAKGQVDTPPKSSEDALVTTGVKGIASLEETLRETESWIDKQIFGDGVVRPAGPTIIRRN